MDRSLSVYIHIPFCGKKCPYCSFAVAVNQGHREEEYLDAIEQEAMRNSAPVSTLYIGGGTPSCLSPAGLKRLMNMRQYYFPAAAGAEISIELNPESVSPERLEILKNAGVTRVSMGVQSLNDTTLERLGRPHRREDVTAAFALLRSAGFQNINLDFIFGLPGQLARDVMADLEQVLLLGSEHCSLYALNIEPKSLFYARGMEVDQEAQGELYTSICQCMQAIGVFQYEVSNFSRPGFDGI